jgi:diacylglycerol kinase family enzyme
MASVALLSNPKSTGNRSLLPRVRAFCAEHEDIFHYEVEDVSQIGRALRTIARVRPKVIVINGGDGTVQAALTELHQGGHFDGPDYGGAPPPVAVLPNGKTNLIAHDLGAAGDPIEALERVLALVRGDMVPHIVSRELIALSGGKARLPGADGKERPVLGMFLGGAGLADTILYCRHKIYPLGLPNWAAHFVTFVMGMISVIVGRSSRLLPAKWAPLKVSVTKSGEMSGRFAFVMVTTLEKLLLNGNVAVAGQRPGAMQLLVIERNLLSILGALFAALRGRLGLRRIRGVHLERGDEIRIEGHQSNVILDGEMFEAENERPIVLRPTAPMPFLRLAA